MNAFDTIRYNFAIIGISPNQSGQMHLFNPRNCVALVLIAINLILNVGFLIHDADSFQKYVSSAYTCSTLLACIIAFEIVIWKTTKIFIFLDRVEEIIENRKLVMLLQFAYGCYSTTLKENGHYVAGQENPISKNIYTETGRKIQAAIKILNFVMVKVSPICLILPEFMRSFYAYFTTDLGNDAFVLLFPVWWALQLLFSAAISVPNYIE